LIVAIAALFVDQVPPVVAFASVDPEPTHKVVLPEIAATLGKAFTVIVVAAEVAEQPLLLLTVSV
jgi:hypothetical protein